MVPTYLKLPYLTLPDLVQYPRPHLSATPPSLSPPRRVAPNPACQPSPAQPSQDPSLSSFSHPIIGPWSSRITIRKPKVIELHRRPSSSTSSSSFLSHPLSLHSFIVLLISGSYKAVPVILPLCN
ncbi:hypothetical protein VTL71DRAFT_3046 [Oculimacula yallundae]|uniref:Uncharacterized protein n=1 Tax=Oculimacula yallundae TaxID=86028 RepID=A0ABR4C763_9HELO